MYICACMYTCTYTYKACNCFRDCDNGIPLGMKFRRFWILAKLMMTSICPYLLSLARSCPNIPVPEANPFPDCCRDPAASMPSLP